MVNSNVTDKPFSSRLGGGDGLNSPFLGQGTVHVFDISGVDVVEDALPISGKQALKYNYDLISCLQVLEHVASPEILLREIMGYMSENSKLYIEVPLERIMEDPVRHPNPGQEKLYWHEHINFYTENSLRKLCKRAGLEVLDILNLSIDLGARKAKIIGIATCLSR